MSPVFKNPFADSWIGRDCHPDAPAGGGGPGGFSSAGPLCASTFDPGHLPHPRSPAARFISHHEIGSASTLQRLGYLYEAYHRCSGDMLGAAIFQETGCQLGHLIEGFLPGLREMLLILGATSVLGASVTS